MRLLLDTHAFVWALVEPARLSRRALAAIENPASSILVSAASALEIATKHRLGTLPGVRPLLEAYAVHLAAFRAEELPILSTHALRAGAFAMDHRDPFDRLLAAQALIESIPLVTADPAFAQFEGVETLW